jgi:hypothetical protein
MMIEMPTTPTLVKYQLVTLSVIRTCASVR